LRFSRLDNGKFVRSHAGWHSAASSRATLAMIAARSELPEADLASVTRERGLLAARSADFGR
jgi:hypothetical protein